MPLLCRRAQLLYFPVPKTGCTSIKNAIFEIENGFQFRRYRVGDQFINVHNFHRDYASSAWDPDHRWQGNQLYRLAIVRDPVARVISAYSNRVLHHGALQDNNLRGPLPDHLSAEPSLNDFITHLEDYRAVSQPVKHHTESIVHYLGSDPDYFNGVFGLHQMGAVEALLRERAPDRPFEMRRLQVGGPKFAKDEVSPENIRALEERFAQDYEVYGAWFR